MFERTNVKYAIAALVASGGILGVACTQPPPPRAEATGESEQRLGEGGCAFADVTDTVPEWPNYLPVCYNWGVTGVDTTWATPNKNASSAGYCPDQAIYDLVRARACSIQCRGIYCIPCGANSVMPHLEIPDQDPNKPINCSLLSASVGIMVKYNSMDEAFQALGTSTAPMVAEGTRCVVGNWSGNAPIPMDPNQYAAVRFIGEIYYTSKGQGLSYTSQQLTVQDTTCIE